MNRYYIRFLLKRDLKSYKLPAAIVLILLPIIQICSFTPLLRDAYDRLLRIVIDDPLLQSGHREPDPNLTAAALPELLDEAGLIASAVIAVLLLMALTLPAFLGDTKDGKNIAAQMRMPISRLHYYGVRMALPTAAMAAFWLAELLTVLLLWGMYHIMIPAECMPAGIDAAPWTAEFCRLFFPFADLSRLPAAVCGILLFPAASVLCALAARGRDIFCICTALAALAGCVLFFMPGTLSDILVPVITVITVLSGGWAVCRRRIF